MKVTHRIPTTQYGYVEVETAEGLYENAAEIRSHHDIMLAAFAAKPEGTLPDKEMTDFIYNQLTGSNNHIETYELMNPAQKTFINQLKKALARKKPI